MGNDEKWAEIMGILGEIKMHMLLMELRDLVFDGIRTPQGLIDRMIDELGMTKTEQYLVQMIPALMPGCDMELVAKLDIDRYKATHCWPTILSDNFARISENNPNVTATVTSVNRMTLQFLGHEVTRRFTLSYSGHNVKYYVTGLAAFEMFKEGWKAKEAIAS